MSSAEWAIACATANLPSAFSVMLYLSHWQNYDMFFEPVGYARFDIQAMQEELCRSPRNPNSTILGQLAMFKCSACILF
jgi:hypothetical protein